MKIALISDVHANLPALEAIEQDLRFQGADIVINLGDIIGYGPHPCQCLAKLRHIASVMIKGNHSLALTDTREAYRMNPNAKAGDEFSRRELSVDDIIYLAQLPLSLELPEYRICLTHGASWLHPEKMEYLEGILHAQGVINHTPQPLYFMGHSHIPEAYHRPNGHQKLETCDLNKPVPINYEDKYLINVGSVG